MSLKVSLSSVFFFFSIISFWNDALSMKINYIYDDCEAEHHSGVVIILQKQDKDPNKSSMNSNYNRMCAALLKGNHYESNRYLKIEGLNDQNMDFARALMGKVNEVCTNREVYVRISFYNQTGEKNDILTQEWEPYHNEITKICLSQKEYYDNFYDEDGEPYD